MPFLQSVTKHADKLKQTGESKIISKEGGLLLKDNLEGGATWAYEVGSQSMVCPIIVEDLNQPRQMLVEMLCEERGLFLEIADIIRGLGLTILMGVMENKERQNMGTIYCRGEQRCHKDGDIHLTRSPLGANSKRWNRTCQCC
ncbi:transcription factor LHW-like [Solanum verrucosum]|uniref:transcription factor LHW-like n=1 Tax=Solanum verrucosum TaxID=315347 RepID=UPI0020D00596|nr:transcription factor LHW-like [Solanum verrucosum]